MSIKMLMVVLCATMFCLSFSVEATTFTYSYDSLGRITNTISSDGSAESYSYDQSGNRLSRTIQTATVKLDEAPPSTPSNLVQTAFVPSKFSFQWERAYDFGGSGLAGYKIFANGNLIGSTTGTNFSFLGLYPDSQYCLTVAAYDHYDNLSPQSQELCFITPNFQPPYLNALGFATNRFQISISDGTAGSYELWGSSNLVDWQKWTTITLPLTNGYYTTPETNIFTTPYFYRLIWSTNVP